MTKKMSCSVDGFATLLVIFPSPAEIHSVEDKFDAVEVAPIELEEGHIICGLRILNTKMFWANSIERHSLHQNIHDDR